MITIGKCLKSKRSIPEDEAFGWAEPVIALAKGLIPMIDIISYVGFTYLVEIPVNENI